MKLLPPLLLCLFWALFNRSAVGQSLFSQGSRADALAGATTGLNDCWSVFGNQAGLAGQKSIAAGGVFQNKFLVRELSTRSGFITIPVQSSVFAISIAQFGQKLFRQEKYGLTYSRKLTPHLNFGLQFNAHRIFFSEENRTAGTYGLEVGFQYLKSEKLILGFHLTNPYQSKIKLSAGSYQNESLIRLGSYYWFSNEFSAIAELENSFDEKVNVKAGFEYVLIDKLVLRAGVTDKPFRVSGGFGLKLKRLTLDQAFSYTRYLGYSPSVSFQYRLK